MVPGPRRDVQGTAEAQVAVVSIGTASAAPPSSLISTSVCYCAVGRRAPPPRGSGRCAVRWHGMVHSGLGSLRTMASSHRFWAPWKAVSTLDRVLFSASVSAALPSPAAAAGTSTCKGASSGSGRGGGRR